MTKPMTYATIIALVLSILAGTMTFSSENAVAGTFKNGTISTDDTWGIAGSPYWIDGDVFVESQATLTIDAGVEVLFNDGFGLYINNGTLNATGAPGNMIKFSANSPSPAPGSWPSIRVNALGNATIMYCNITYAVYGVYLFQSSDNTIKNNLISSNSQFGIYLDESPNNIIEGNEVFDNFWRGITLYSSHGNMILNNTVYDSFYGLYISLSEYNNISFNDIHSNGLYGFFLRLLSHNNNITKNMISENTGYGLYVDTSSDNHIYHNIFLNNTNQGYDESSPGNFWDNGYPAGGNYWSDYDEPAEGAYDNLSGPDQDETGSDGIVDRSYKKIDNGTGPKAYDNYPLIYPSVTRTFVHLRSPINNSIVKPGTALDFAVVGDDIVFVNYSVNGSANQTLSSPYDINGTETGSWSDGTHIIEIFVIDGNGNVTGFLFNLTIDSIKPEIILNSPPADSLILPGISINLSVIDTNLDFVNYTVNAGLNTTLAAPFDINTIAWYGNYTVRVYAVDLAGNLNTTYFNFTVDGEKPQISIIPPPSNNSVINPGAILNFSVTDMNLNTSSIDYSINGVGPFSFSISYELNTSSWADDNYIIEINASDTLNNKRTSFFNITIDSVAPQIIHLSPPNGSTIPAGTDLVFDIIDDNLNIVNYFRNFDPPVFLPSPFEIDTSSWADGFYNISIKAEDLAGNIRTSYYRFTIATFPTITLNAPLNNSVIIGGDIIDLTVEDTNLALVNYSRNGEPQLTIDPLNHPTYLIDTSGWGDGYYIIEIFALDSAGNMNTTWYNFTIDSTPPSIVLNSPTGYYVFPSGFVLDFDIFDPHLTTVLNSTDSGPYLPLSSPYQISTAGWPDGDYSIRIKALDSVWNENITEFNITLDSVNPQIQLVSPSNGTSSEIGIIIDIQIIDANLNYANYSVNSGTLQPFGSPFDINTSGFPDGLVTVEIYAFDMAGNSNFSWYEFIFDDNTKPEITLNSPQNNSIVPAGTKIDLLIFDLYLRNASYSLDGINYIPFSDPYDIDTTGWDNGFYTISIYTNDTRNNQNTSQFIFTIDSTPPIILPESPQNNSVVTPGTILQFFIDDDTQVTAVFSMLGGPSQNLTSPYDIDTSGWLDEIYTILIEAEDEAGNINSKWFRYTIDSQPPAIILNSPANVSIIPSGISLDFTISDANIDIATYYINGVGPTVFYPPYDINTSGWEDGTYTVKVNVNDTAGNTIEEQFIFTLDSTSPRVTHVSVTSPYYPYNYTTLIFKFSEAMDAESVESALKISPDLNYSLEWYDMGKTLLLSNIGGMVYFTTYTVTLEGDVVDLAGNTMTNFTSYIFKAKIDENLDTDLDGMPDGWEVLYQLDPSDPSDAEEDMDSDGYTNLEEFEGNSDPTNPESIPTKPKQEVSSLDYWWLIPILAALLAMTIILFFLLMGERKEEEKGPVEELEDMYMAMRAEKDIKFMEAVLADEEKLGESIHEAEIIVQKAKEAFEKKDYNLVLVFEKTIRDMVGEDVEEDLVQSTEKKEDKSKKEP